jgi:DNA mismatch endonuclease (patch repair protein)
VKDVRDGWISTRSSLGLSGRRSRDTAPEMVLRKRLHRLGLRYRIHVAIGDRLTADLMFQKSKVAVFVDGCFWHSCPRHGRRIHAGPNGARWEAKFRRIKRCEQRADEILSAAQFNVLRIWECEIQSNLASACSRVENAVRRHKGTPLSRRNGEALLAPKRVQARRGSCGSQDLPSGLNRS